MSAEGEPTIRRCPHTPRPSAGTGSDPGLPDCPRSATRGAPPGSRPCRPRRSGRRRPPAPCRFRARIDGAETAGEATQAAAKVRAQPPTTGRESRTREHSTLEMSGEVAEARGAYRSVGRAMAPTAVRWAMASTPEPRRKLPAGRGSSCGGVPEAARGRLARQAAEVRRAERGAGATCSPTVACRESARGAMVS
eukprot:scaffold3544_cov373-Prasinococcus_capsulatus_cf.AAC.1